MLTKKEKKETYYKPKIGEKLFDAIGKALLIANENGRRVSIVFNGVNLIVGPKSTFIDVLEEYENSFQESPLKEALKKRIQESINSEREARKEKVLALIKKHPMDIKSGKEEEFHNWCAKNNDTVAQDLVKFTKAFAISLQKEIEKGSRITKELLSQVEGELDYFGHSGASYSFCYNSMKYFWKHSDMLTDK